MARKNFFEIDLTKLVLLVLVILLVGMMLLVQKNQETVSASIASLENRIAEVEKKFLEAKASSSPSAAQNAETQANKILGIALTNADVKTFVASYPDYSTETETLEGAALEEAKTRYPVLYGGINATRLHKITFSSPSSANSLIVVQDDATVYRVFPVIKISVG